MSLSQSPRSMAAAFQATASLDPSAVALRTVGGATSITWQEYAGRVRAIAEGMAASGVKKGDTVALMLSNRPEFFLVDTAAIHLGAVPFSIYNTSSPEQIAFIFSNAQPALVICEEQFLSQVRKAGTTATVVCVDGSAPGNVTLTQLESQTADGFDFDAAWQAVSPADLLTLIYTSGTTGDPKGVQLTHGGMLAELAGTNAVLNAGPGDRLVSFLPSAHIADRWSATYMQMRFGTQVTSVADRLQLMSALAEVRPTIFGAVPQLWQKVRAGIDGIINAEQDETRKAGLAKALEIGRSYVGATQAGDIPAELEAAFNAVDAQVFSAIRAKLGLDQARIVFSGGAPLAAELAAYFHVVGIPLADIWGMSELSCIGAISPVGGIKIGTVGKPLAGVEMRLAEDGELLVRGPIVTTGYLGRPDLTAEAIDADGWFHTGDIGQIDDDGYVRIIDRKKELIINSHGKNMSPVNIENAVKSASPLIGQVVAIGDNRPFTVALLVLDPDACAVYAQKRGLASADPAQLASDAELSTLIAAAVETANASLSRVEQIKKFAILPTVWAPGSEVLTHTMKLRRRSISDIYASEIEALYS